MLEPRIFILRYLRKKAEMQIALSVLPRSLSWINTMGATVSLVKNTGLVQRSAVQFFPSGAIPERRPYLDGPYLSEEHAVHCSLAYHLIIRPNSKKATDVFLNRLKRHHAEAVDYFTEAFISHLPYILEHTFIGNMRGNGITGVHYETSDVRLKRFLRSNINSITRFSLIEKVNPLNGDVLTKNQPSTFWPKEWSIDRCIIECAIAWSNKVPSNSSDILIGYTSTGLKIKFCFRADILKTVYPDESNNEERSQ